MVRAPGGQLITRIKTEAAAGKLLGRRRQSFRPRPDAGHRGPVPGLRAAERQGLSRRRAGRRRKLWPRSTLGWSIAYNTELEKNPPKTWMDLCKPEYGTEEDRPGGRAVRRHDLDPHHVRAAGARRRLLEEAGRDAAGALSRPARRLSDAMVRGEVSIARAALQHRLHQEARRRAGRDRLPVRTACRSTIYAAGVTKTAANPNAAQAVPQLEHVRGRAGLPDQGARLPDGAEECRRSIRRATTRR